MLKDILLLELLISLVNANTYREQLEKKYHKEIELAIKLIKHHEGYSNVRYTDTKGNATYLYGMNIEKMSLGVIHELQEARDYGVLKQYALKWLKEKVIDCIINLERRKLYSWDKIGIYRRVVLIDMYFNMGRKLFTFRKMLSYLDDENYTDASNEILNSSYVNQVHSRAYNLARILLNGDESELYTRH